jgi:hypothetical protein
MRRPAAFAASIWPSKARQPSGRVSEQAEFLVLVFEVGDDLQPAGAGGAHGMGDGGEFGGLGVQGGDVLAVQRAVIERARRGKPECAGADALLGQFGHALAIRLGRRFAVGAALAHDIDAQRGMRHLGGDVRVVAARIERVEEIGKAVPVPGESFRQDDLGDVFHALHQAHQHVALIGMAGCEADPAIAEQDGGDAIPGGWREAGAPGRLGVVVGVHIDETWSDQLAFCVDLGGADGQGSADRGDTVAGDGDVGPERVAAAAVHDGAVADDEVRRGGHCEDLRCFEGAAYRRGEG